MWLPAIAGLIKRRLLVNFRADPEIVQRLLPQPFRPKLHKDNALVGVCLIRLQQVRPAGLPDALGISSENAAHRIAVEWLDEQGRLREGVYVPRRDTDSLFNRLAGGRFFPGEQHGARFEVKDADGHIELSMESLDQSVTLEVVANDAPSLPPGSCFASPEDASAFFEHGDLGFSPARGGRRLDALQLHVQNWLARPLQVSRVHSSFFEDSTVFPSGSVEFDHGLVMRDIRHEWHGADGPSG